MQGWERLVASIVNRIMRASVGAKVSMLCLEFTGGWKIGSPGLVPVFTGISKITRSAVIAVPRVPPRRKSAEAGSNL